MGDPSDTEIAAARALAMLARFAERSLGDLSLAHYRVLSGIAGGDERASRLAAKLALGKPAISAAVDALTKASLVSRAVVPGDHRAVALRLTPAGYAVLERAERDLAAGLRRLAAATSGGVIEALAALGVPLEAEAAARGLDGGAAAGEPAARRSVDVEAAR